MNCSVHTNTETSLKCAKCGRPICPRCLVETPVGARCADCARLQRLPTFSVSLSYYLRAAGAGLAAAVAYGALWQFIMHLVPIVYLSLLFGPGAGYAISEVISLSVNRKRGRGLAIAAAIMVALSYVVSLFLPLGQSPATSDIMFRVVNIAATALGIFIAIGRLR